MSARETLPPVRGERAGERRLRAAEIMGTLHQMFPDARCALHFESPFQLLVATILSAQCTDERVNQVTPALFVRFPDAEAMAAADIAELEALVLPTGFYRQKAKNIRRAAQQVIDEFDGVLPETVDELAMLAGAARKTANVVVSNCFPANADGIAVDTHVQRIARRLGLTRSWETPKIERDLMRVLDHDEWNHVTHLLIEHGRATCGARSSPRCDDCELAALCPSAGRWATP